MPAKANLVDRAIELFAPGLAVRREQARMQISVLRAYEAAAQGRRTQGWRAGSGSANAEVIASLGTVRNRSRQMVRDNEYAKAAIRALATGIVGSTGINVIPDSKAERTTWRTWVDGECDADAQLDFGGLQLLAAKHWKADGEVLIRRRWRKPEDGLAVPMQIQLLEPDHLDHTKTGTVENGNIAIAGVEYDLIGRRVAYWLFPEHPGEVATISRALQSKRVPASEVIHLYGKERISQVRGMPELSVTLMRLRDLDGYEEAELVRKKIEACFTAFVTTDRPNLSLGELAKKEDGAGTGARPIEKISPGLIKYLNESESVTFGTPQATGGYGEYTSNQLHAVAVGAGVTYHQLTGDTSRSSYTSHRAALRAYYDLVESEQWLTLIPGFIKPVRRWFREASVLAGQRVGNKPDRITTPRKHMVDPLKDGLADKEEIRAGLKSLSEALRERGYDPEEVFDEIKNDRAKLAALGLVFDTDATVTQLKLSPLDLLSPTDKQDTP